MSALEAYHEARKAGVEISRSTPDQLHIRVKPPLVLKEVVASLRPYKDAILRIEQFREAARTAYATQMPPDCTAERWQFAKHGLKSFITEGWGDGAALARTWTIAELYAVPPLWARIDLTGVALLINDPVLSLMQKYGREFGEKVGLNKVVEFTPTKIVIKCFSGVKLKFRRAPRKEK
jgi:hypothetical protein